MTVICLVWNFFPCDFTYCQSQRRNNQDQIYYSTLDHFIVSENLLDQCVDAAPIHIADNLSNHEPIYLKLRLDPGDMVNLNCDVNDESEPKTRKPAWNKAKDEHIRSYMDELATRLSLIQSPVDALSCNNLQCRNNTHKSDADLYAVDILDAISESVKNNIPYTSSHKKKVIPGWNEIVKPFKDDAAFWYSIWVSLGRPQNNNLHLVMKKTRNKYHQILRKVKNQEKELRDDRFMNDCLNGNINNVFSEIRQLRSNKSPPSTVDGVRGEKNIAEHFKSIYSQLYNTHHDENEVRVIKDRINGNINQEDHQILNKITPNLLSKIINKMKKGKNDVQYDWRSEALKHANIVISSHVSNLFRIYLVHNHMTLALLKSALIPIIKDPNSMQSSSENYRAIAISSIIVKLMDYTIYELQPEAFATSPYQFGFKSNTSTTMCSWAVLETINYFTNRGSVVYACFLDLKKAFDLVKLSILFTKLENKLSPILGRFIIHCYTRQSCCVRWNGSESSIFMSTNGVRQGAAISPMLFAVYIDELFLLLQDSGLGCHVKHQFAGVFGYADDIVLLSPTKAGLQSMLNMCAEFFSIHGIQISVNENAKKSKTKGMVFNHKEGIPANLMIGSVRVPWTNKYKHLGHYIHDDEDMSHDLNAKRGEFISNIHSLRQEFGRLNPHVFLRLVSTYCSSFYGSNIWDLSGDSAIKLWTTWNVLLKTSFNLPFGTHRYFLNNIVNQPHLKLKLLKRFVNFHDSIVNTDSALIQMLYNEQHHDVRSVFGRNCSLLMDLCGGNGFSSNKVLQHIVYPVPEGQQWRLSMLHELLDLRGAGSQSLNTEEIDVIMNYICCH